MSVDIEPSELSFQRPFTVEVARTLRIKNPNQFPIAFKVKTTAPKQYCVRPNSGRVEPGQDVEATVLLQAMKQEPPLDAKCRDKFLVQSVPITADKEFASIAVILDQADKSSVIERKIRVNWLAAEDSSPTEFGVADASADTSTPKRRSGVNGDYTPDVSNAYSSPGQEADSSASPGTSAAHPYPSTPDLKNETISEKAQSTVSAASHIVAHTAQVSYDELKHKLALAEAKIASLQDTNGLRQRVKTETDKLHNTQEATAMIRQEVAGVPVQMVAVLCLFSFLIAYFFF